MVTTTLDDLLRDQRLLEARIRFAVVIGLTPPVLPRPYRAAGVGRVTPSSLRKTRKSVISACNSARLSV